MNYLFRAFFISAFIFLSNISSAQAPSGISFQGLALDSANRSVNSKTISIRVSFLNERGLIEYQELHKPRTDKYGQFTLVLGKGVALQGAFDQLNWPAVAYSLTTEIDLKGGSDYKTVASRQPFQSVPYAFFATNAAANGNTLTGFKALDLNISGQSNSAYGYNALAKNKTGAINNAFGEYALYNNLNANNNAFGGSSLYSNTSGTNNAAFGNGSLFSNNSHNNNTAMGNASLYSNTAHANTGFGFRTLAYNRTGQNNVAVGAQSLEKNSMGSGNTALGAYSNVTDSGLNNVTVIGFDARVSSSNTMAFGNSGVSKWAFGLSTTNYALQVGSNGTNGNGAYLTPGGTWTNASSILFKEQFEEVDGNEILQKVSTMQILKWKYKYSDEYHIGPFAEEFKHLFSLGMADDQYHISTIDVSGIALRAIQELNKKYDSEKITVRQELNKRDEQIKDLLNRIEQLEKLLSVNVNNH